MTMRIYLIQSPLMNFVGFYVININLFQVLYITQKNLNKRIGLDLDDTINYWYCEYLKIFGTPKDDYEITKNVVKLSKDRNFWLNLPVKNYPDFEPTLYCTKRIIPKAWSRKYLQINNLPIAPIYQVYYQKDIKSRFIKGRVDLFIDDSISNMIELNLAGIPCLLMNSEENKKWGPIGRIYSLNYDEIMSVDLNELKEYVQWISTIQ